MRNAKFDELVKSRKSTPNVIPAKAGIQKYQMVKKLWTPAFAGVTTFYEAVKFKDLTPMTCHQRGD